jgi:hypothetical protein
LSVEGAVPVWVVLVLDEELELELDEEVVVLLLAVVRK